MDIRRFMTGGAKTAPKPAQNNATSKKKAPEPKKTVAPKAKTPVKDKKKPDKKPEKSSEVVLIESDSEDPPIKVKQRNVKKEEKTITKNEKPQEKKSKNKAKEVSLPTAEVSPSEKENKEKETEKKEKKEKEPKKNTNKRDKSEERKGEKRKSLKVESSDEDEVFSGKRKPSASSKGKSKKGAIIFDSDSDEDPIPPTQREIKKARRKKTSNFVSDSDEEERQMSITKAFQKVTRNSPRKEPSKSAEKPKMKTCSLTDFFGASSSPVHRVERKVLPVKRKAEASPKKAVVIIDDKDDDMEIHDDDDFEQTLLQLDTSLEQKPKKQKLDEPSPSKASSSSLASKLSSRLKSEETRVAETPERKKSVIESDTEVIEDTPAKRSPVKRKTRSPVKPLVKPRTPPKTRSPVKQNTPRVSPRKSTDTTPAAEGTTPKGGRGGPGYRSYLQRAPPQALGSKEIPEGAPNCLEGLTFVISGVLESLERDEAKTLVERYGGKVTTSLSKKTSYIVFGRDAGVSKTAKAEEFGTKQLDEDGLLNLVKTAPGKKSKYEINAEAAAAKEKKQQTPKGKPGSVSKTPTASPKLQRFSHSTQPSPLARQSTSSQPSPKTSKPSPRTPATASPAPSSTASPKVGEGEEGEGLMWVDRYKPKNLKQVIGQQGPKSNANKLLNWLKNWHRWQAEGRKPAFNSRFSDDGAGYRAALLSGPPGVGKTTTATLVCQEMGFSYVELNASDTRSKKSLETEVAELLGNHTLVDFLGGARAERAAEGKRHCLIMDEVDGMAGNEDRGGMQELIGLIKKSRIPIICMCNDRNHQKVRSLANYCFDLRFQRPRVEQIKAAMMSLAYKEGIKIPPPALNEVISAANQDIRQVIHNLSMWTASDKALTYDQVKKDAAKAHKDMKMGPFDVCRKVFVGGEETANMTVNDKSDLFFHDYSFGPLFVHENYIHALPYAARGDKKKHLECISSAIDSIADGDLVDRRIRSNQNWSLLPLQAMFSSVIPGEAMRGGFNQMVSFPQWLGKNSSTNKTDRILQELHTHMSLHLSGDRRALNMDYLPHFRRRLTRPLVDHQNDGVGDVIDILDAYDLLREDYDNVLDISQWSHLKEPLAGVDSKTKAAFTRTYNKGTHLTPYAAVVGAKKGRGRGGGAAGAEELGMDNEDGAGAGEDTQSDEDVSNDAMIKPKKKPAKGKAAAATTATSSKGKGRGKGQSAGRGRGRGKKK